MRKLIDVEVASTGQSAVVYGAPKSGKTEMVGKLAAKYNVLWLDLEKGFLTLKKLPAEYQQRINLISIPDTKDNPVAIDTVLRILNGKKVLVCEAHGKANCVPCKRDGIVDEICLDEFTSEDLLVIDSGTQLSDSAMNKATKGMADEEKTEFKHYDLQGILLSKALGLIQAANYNVVLITHEQGIELEDKTEKIVPSMGTKNFARKCAKYFDHVVHLSLKNRKHKAASKSTAETKILTGSRTDVAIEDDPDMLLLNIFEGKGKADGKTPAVSPTRKSAATVAEATNSESALTPLQRLQAKKAAEAAAKAGA